MSLRNWLLAAVTSGLIGSVLPAIAQNAMQSELAKVPDMLETAEPDSIRAARRGASGGISEDAAIGTFGGLVENGWDFNRPETIPGFGPLPAQGGVATSAAK
jgi:hypothetical protein